MRYLILTILLTACMPGVGAGAVIHVEKDGTGDFTVIQDAVDAAQGGDTIMIGPGRYSEVHDFDYYWGETIQVCVTIDKSLSIIGAGRDVTFIEPSDATRHEYDPGGLASRSSGLEVFLSDFTIENCPGNALLFDMETGGRLEMTRVDIENCFFGVALKRTVNSHIHDCTFQTTLDNTFWAWRADGLLVEDCQFFDRELEFYETQNSVISNCRWDDASTGVALSFCEGISVSSCQISNADFRDLSIWGSQNIQITDVEAIGHSLEGIVLYGTETQNIEIRDSVFKGGEVTMYIARPIPGLVIENNHILPSDSGWTVWALNPYYSGPDTWIDMANNYWGTIDPDEVAASIHDGHDDDNCHMFINFEPMAGGPVGTQQITLEGLKALFR